jgi:hypothetical protein
LDAHIFSSIELLVMEIPDQLIVTLLIGLLLKCWRKSVSVDQKIHIKNEERMSNAATTRAT